MRPTKRSAAMVVAALWMIGCGMSRPAGPVVHERQTIERGAATHARVEIDECGRTGAEVGSAKLFEGDFDFNVPDLKPVIAYAVNGTTGTLKLSQGSASGSYENTWRLNLNESTPLDLDVTLSAGDAQPGRLNLETLTVQLGAGDINVDLRGTPAKSYSVMVRAGAGDATIRLPASVGISVRTSGLIGDTNVSGLEKRDGRWINPRADGSPVTVDVQVQHGIGDLRLVAE